MLFRVFVGSLRIFINKHVVKLLNKIYLTWNHNYSLDRLKKIYDEIKITIIKYTHSVGLFMGSFKCWVLLFAAICKKKTIFWWHHQLYFG